MTAPKCGCFEKKSPAISWNRTTIFFLSSPHPSAYAVILQFAQSFIIKVVKDDRWQLLSVVYLHCSGDKIVSIVFILSSYVRTSIQWLNVSDQSKALSI